MSNTEPHFYDLSTYWQILSLTGPDTLSFLQNITPNDVSGLYDGRGHHNAFLDKKSEVLADFWLYRQTDTHFTVVTESHQTEAFQAAADSYLFAEELSIVPVQHYCYLIHGHRARQSVLELFPNIEDQLLPDSITQTNFEDKEILIIQRTFSGYPSFILTGESSHACSIKQLLLNNAGLDERSVEDYDLMRLESGVPEYGKDFDNSFKLLELNRPDEMINFEKGCYPGQEIVARTRRRGTPRRLLLGLTWNSEERFPTGSPITFNDKESGTLMSNAWSPSLGYSIGLAYINKTLQLEDGSVDIRINDSALNAKIVYPPFVFPEELRQEALDAYQSGMDEFHNDNHEKAKTHFSHAISLDPHYVDAYEALGVTLERMERYDEALVHNRRFADRKEQ